MHERGIRKYPNDDIGARYGRRYTIDEPTVTYLAKRVEALLHLTEERCNEKIATRPKAAN